MSLVDNEKTKLTATWLSGISVAAVAVGGIGPVIGAAIGTMEPIVASLLALGWITIGAGLHLGARAILERLKDVA